MGGDNRKKKVSTVEQGNVVEEIVAMMHERSGVEVRRDVRLPAKRSGKCGRQIDVLLIGDLAGYPMMIAIECKNFKKRRLNVRNVGAFRDLLEDVGLAPQQGIMVSSSGVGDGAMERAAELGMRVFELSGLTADKLEAVAREAQQRVVTVVPAMSHLALTDNVGPEANWEELGTFRDEKGNVVGLLPDLLWFKWLEGEVPSVLGEHAFELEVPKGWHRSINGRREPVLSISATAKVHAAVVTLPGQATEHALVDPSGPKVEKYRARVSFDAAPGEYPVRNFSDEAEFESFLGEQAAAFTVTVGRIRAPRMIVNHVFWPPSARVARRLQHLEKFHKRGRLAMSPENLRGVEGTDLRTLWEPVVDGYPAVYYLRRKENG